MVNFKKGIVSLVLSTGILLGGCANVREGEIVAKEYQEPKKGTPLFGFTSPAVFTASLVLKAATMREERYDNYIERYDFVQIETQRRGTARVDARRGVLEEGKNGTFSLERPVRRWVLA